MPDRLSAEARSALMGKVRSKGNRTTEILFVKELKRNKITGWRRHIPMLGKPDFIFRTAKLAIFIDGCFWHGCPSCYRRPTSNTEYWDKKVQRNVSRDQFVTGILKEKGWTVLRFWEHELKGNDFVCCLRKVKRHSKSILQSQ